MNWQPSKIPMERFYQKDEGKEDSHQTGLALKLKEKYTKTITRLLNEKKHPPQTELMSPYSQPQINTISKKDKKEKKKWNKVRFSSFGNVNGSTLILLCEGRKT